MTRVDLGYPIFIGDGIADELRTFVAERAYRRVIVLCDSNVAARARALMKPLKEVRAILAFPLGERRKTLRSAERVLAALAQAGADRATLVVGIGGGVAGDLFGFCASIYMRGVPFVNVATSLVAMVDAAVGGKTGVDLRAGKNLAGTFTDPVAVFCDVDALRTLPERHIREGLAELVKHGIIEGNDAFEELEALAPHPFGQWPWEAVVSDSVKVKAMVVGDDRMEAGRREVLNLGHTVGHAIELTTNYRTSHGQGVAIGLRAAGLLAMRSGRFSTHEHLRVLSLLALLRLPLTLNGPEPEALLEAMKLDKKVRDGKIRFVLPRSIGDVEYGVTVPDRTVRAVLQRCTRAPDDREFR